MSVMLRKRVSHIQICDPSKKKSEINEDVIISSTRYSEDPNIDRVVCTRTLTLTSTLTYLGKATLLSKHIFLALDLEWPLTFILNLA